MSRRLGNCILHLSFFFQVSKRLVTGSASTVLSDVMVLDISLIKSTILHH